jgi:hypothetical protein
MGELEVIDLSGEGAAQNFRERIGEGQSHSSHQAAKPRLGEVDGLGGY